MTTFRIHALYILFFSAIAFAALLLPSYASASSQDTYNSISAACRGGGQYPTYENISAQIGNNAGANAVWAQYSAIPITNNCSTADKAALRQTIGELAQEFNTNVNVLQDPNATPEQQQQAANALNNLYKAESTVGTNKCSLLNWSFQDCVWIPLMSWLGSWFLTIGGAALRLAGTLFDTLILRIVVDFKGSLTTVGALPAIEQGWTIFRDFTNVLIIGLFVFIAISIILGLQEFGQKRLIINVIVVAVLINFSLLFTKIIIDTSNLTAFAVYKQMAGNGAAQTFDMAGAFLKPMGITSVWDDTSLITNQVGQTTGSAMQAFIFGFVGGFLLLVAAAVLFYGCFLLAARGLLLMFLMLTAAIAFATYLHPSLSQGEFGWKNWWKTLFNSAVFAPLLMLFLAVSLAIMGAAGSRNITPDKTIGAIISNPQSQLTTDAWTTIFIYLMGVGLLFLSLRMSSKFAGSISGLSFATGAAAIAAKFPLRLAVGGGSSLASSALQNRLGGSAASRSAALEAEINRKNMQLNQGGLSRAEEALRRREIANLKTQKAKLDARASKDYNFLNTTVGKALGKGLGLEAGKPKGGYVGPRKEAADAAAKDTAGLALSRSDAAKIVDESLKGQQDIERERLRSEQSTNKAVLAEMNKVAKEAKNASPAQKQLEESIKALASANKNKTDIDKQHLSGAISKAQRDQQIQAEDERIKQARESITAARNTLHEIDATHGVHEQQARVNEMEQRIKDLNKQRETAIDAVVNRSVQNATAIAKDIHHLDEYSTGLAAKNIRTKLGNKRAVDLLKGAQSELKGELGDGNQTS